MKTFLIYFLIFITGAFLSGSFAWVYSYYPKLKFVKDTIKIEELFTHSDKIISNENFSCEGKIEQNVGSVVASIIELNRLNKRNMLSFGCFEKTCSLSVSNCMPWQNQECSDRFLKFNLNNSNQILPNTFSCIDIP